MAKYADLLSPMCYHHMLKRDTKWINSVVRDAHKKAEKPVVPSIQVKREYTDKDITVTEFEDALKEALKPPSSGVIFWNWYMLISDSLKFNAARNILQSFRN